MPTSEKRPATTSSRVGRSLKSIVGQSSYCLWEGEDPSEYDTLYDAVVSDIRPLDAAEEVMAAEIVSLTLEVRRFRYLRKMFMKSNSVLGLHAILRDLLDEEYAAEDLTRAWGRGKPSARNRVEKLFQEAGIGIAEVQARTLFARIDDFERIDRMILNADQRRSDIIKEIENRRNGFARRARELFAIEDADVVKEMPARDRTVQAGVPVVASPADVIEADDAYEDQDDDSDPTGGGDEVDYD